MAKKKNIDDFTLTPEQIDELKSGDDLRVIPKLSNPKLYGQNPEPGPTISLDLVSVSFDWGQPLSLSIKKKGLGDFETSKVTKTTLTLCPELFMTEEKYQEFISN